MNSLNVGLLVETISPQSSLGLVFSPLGIETGLFLCPYFGVFNSVT